MPNVTVYIRNDDLDKWKSLKGKSAFIHFMLGVADEEVVQKALKHLKDNPSDGTFFGNLIEQKFQQQIRSRKIS